MLSQFEVKEALPLSDGTAAELRPQWNVDKRSIVFERRTPIGSILFRADFDGLRLRQPEPLELCNKGATISQGRAAFFAQDDFAFVSNRSGSPAIWRAHLGKNLVEPLTLPAADEADYGPTARPDSDGRFAFFRIVGGGKPHLFVGRLGETNGQLATGRLDGDQPWFMPMATQVIFHSRREGDHGLFERAVNRDVHAGRISPNDEGTPYGLRIPPPMAATS